jgi:transcriptional regulator with XRE-family HTH domain
VKRRPPDDQEEQALISGFGERLRDTRERRDMTQKELAAGGGCSPRMVSRFERGDNLPDLLWLAYFRRKLHVSLDYLVVGNSPGNLKDARLLRRLRRLDDLPPQQIEEALRVLDDFLDGLGNAGPRRA